MKPGQGFVNRGGLAKQRSNYAPLSRSASKVGLICPVCGTAFERYACWVKRVKHTLCSRACAAAWKMVRLESRCVVCGKMMAMTPTHLNRIVTCSRECLKIRRRELYIKAHPNGFHVPYIPK